MKPTVLLFDIDGTLVTTGGAGRRAIERGFAAVHGRGDVVSFPMDGMTDRLIARRGLDALGIEATAAAIDRVLDAYLAELPGAIREIPAGRYRIHAGMREAVERATARGAAVGLGTGNLREGARLKLEPLGLHAAFRFGGYGSDAEDRVELIRIGAERGAAMLERPLGACRVVVIGDTPRDVAAAVAIEAESIGVGTGSYSAEALRACGATHAFADLAEPGALDALLGAT